MNLLKEFEIEKKLFISNHSNDKLETEDGILHFFCGMCYKKCYQDNDSGLNFYKKVYLNNYSDKKYKKYLRIDSKGKLWMKVCYRCKYNNAKLGHCNICENYYIKNNND